MSDTHYTILGATIMSYTNIECSADKQSIKSWKQILSPIKQNEGSSDLGGLHTDSQPK